MTPVNTSRQHRYPSLELEAVYKVIAERRDMRHFTAGKVDDATLKRLLIAAHHAPSVGLMQPWRFIRITSQELRTRIYQLVDTERIKTAQAIGEYETTARMAEFLKLKVEGVLECGELLVVALCNQREKHIFGRRTLPEMDIASVSCAIQNLWLAARAEGLGMGWVSMFEPEALRLLMQMPEDAKPIAILCLGHVHTFYKEPMLVETGWTTEKPLSDMLMENGWHAADSKA